jgi:hypothetical protein
MDDLNILENLLYANVDKSKNEKIYQNVAASHCPDLWLLTLVV